MLLLPYAIKLSINPSYQIKNYKPFVSYFKTNYKTPNVIKLNSLSSLGLLRAFSAKARTNLLEQSCPLRKQYQLCMLTLGFTPGSYQGLRMVNALTPITETAAREAKSDAH